MSTILAIASPPGQSLRGIIRISGPDAFSLIEPHVRGGDQSDRTMTAVRLSLANTPAFSALMLGFRSPRSYTGEDSIELQMPGNPALLDRVIAALIASGVSRDLDVRRAEPGEFTARAYLNGRIDLTRAEGVAATIAAQSDAELAAARLLASGRLARLARGLGDDLAGALALVEAGIDFTDQDDVVAISPRELDQRLESISARLQQALDRSVGIEQLRAIPWVVLVGEPNAGKSALFNALLGRERAVVSSIAGTTRDVLAEPLGIDTPHGRAEVMLVDLAGLDDADASSMNTLMQQAAQRAIERAELVLRCVPVDQRMSMHAESPRAAAEILIRTKSDTDPSFGVRSGHETIAVSVMTGEGLDQLRAAMTLRLADRAVSLSAGAIALQPRHEAAMRSALANVNAAITLVQPQREAHALADSELIAASLRAALDDLAALAGEMTPDDILGRIFGSFCIGK